nr:family 16 glycoside hydrolase [Paenibacillus bovis]
MKYRIISLSAMLIALLLVTLTYNGHSKANKEGDIVSKATEKGEYIYEPTENEANIYARVIELENSGAKNGRLLSTFERSTEDGSPSKFIIRASDDNGENWYTLSTVSDPLEGDGHPASNAWQPFLFEFPQQLGEYPAGTIMLVGNTVPQNVNSTKFQAWYSFDQGETWESHGVIQEGGTFSEGIWEPFLYLDNKDQLVMVFADERDSANHSQVIAQVISKDGGKTWSEPTPIVASAIQADRPGMPTVAKVGKNGPYVMAYEICGRAHCYINVKTSANGHKWGDPADLGSRVVTTDGYYPGHSPYITWIPTGGKKGQLVLSSQFTFETSTHDIAPGNYQTVFINTNNGKGDWSWAPAPWKVSNASPKCNANYSPHIMPVGDEGLVRYTAPTSFSSGLSCGERTGVANIGTLPYESNFAENGTSGWALYGGNWIVEDGALNETLGGGGGNKAVTGSTGWKNYVVSGFIKATTDGVPGIAVRVTQPSVGTDSYSGYLVFYDTNVNTFTIARGEYAYQQLASTTISDGLNSNQWYRMTIRVKDNKIETTLETEEGTEIASLTFKDPYNSFPTGMVALRSFAGTASWKDITIREIKPFGK